MNVFKKMQFSKARRRVGGFKLALLGVVLLGVQHSATAHGNLASYIQHGISLKVDARHIDLTLDLTFFEEPSLRERMVMDANADGRITRPEVDAYLKKLAPELSKHVNLCVAGREVPLVPLYDPEMELVSDQTDALAHHRLRLFFFAPTPLGLKANDEILVEDRLWHEVKSLGAQQVEGGDGCRLLPEVQVQKSAAGEWPRESRQFRFCCVKPPNPKPAPASPPSATPSQNKPSVP